MEQPSGAAHAEVKIASDTTTGVAPGILSLSEDIIVRIINLLNPREAILLGSVCQRFRQAVREDRLVWAPICRSIVGADAAEYPQQWGCPTFQILYCKLLRTYGQLLGGVWHSDLQPLGSLLVAFPSPPNIVGAIITSLRLAEPGVSAVPVFSVSYDADLGGPAVTCLRGTNTFDGMLHRLTVRSTQASNAPPADEMIPMHPAEMWLQYADVSPGRRDQGRGSPPSPQLAARASPAPAAQVWDDGGGGGAGADEGGDEAGDDGDLSDYESTGADGTDSDVEGDYGVVDMELAGAELEGGSDGEIAAGGGGSGTEAGASAYPGDQVTGSSGLPRLQPRAYGWGCGGAPLSDFTLSCSIRCCHHQVEAVCRWLPAGLMSLPEAALVHRLKEPGDAAAAGPVGNDGGSSTRTPGGGGSSSAAPGPSLDGDQLVDLDVVAAFPERERGLRVKWTLLCLASYPLSSHVSYRRLIAAPPAAAAGGTAAAAASVSALLPGALSAGATVDGAALRGPVDSARIGPDTSASAAPTGSVGAAAGDEGLQPPQPVPPVSRPPAPAPAPTQPHPLEGIWRGTYGGHGLEIVHVRLVGPQLLEGLKLTGDNNVPAGATSFRIYLARPGASFAQRGVPLRLPPDYASRLEPVTLGLAPAGGGAARGIGRGGAGRESRVPVVLDAFAAEGQVADSGYQASRWVDAEAVVLGRDTFGLLWHEIRSFSAFHRVLLAV